MQFYTALILVCSILGCTSKPASKTTTQSTDTITFYPVAQFVKDEVKYVLKTPYYIYKQTIEKGIVDSVPISSRQFARLAEQFIQPDITQLPLKKEYAETVFLDQSSKTYTINYSTRNRDLEIQNIDVLLQQDASTLKRIFIRKFFNYNNDSSAIEQLSWKPNEQFQISRVVQRRGHHESERKMTIVWNEKK